MAGDTRQGWAIFGAMLLLFIAGLSVVYWAESTGNPAIRALGISGPSAMEGKEVRFGIANSGLFATITTAASCGAVNAAHDSLTPLGGLIPLLQIESHEMRLSQGISIHVIPGEPEKDETGWRRAPRMARPELPMSSYVQALLAVAAVTALVLLFQPALTVVDLNLIYLLPVLLAASRLGLGPAVFAAGIRGRGEAKNQWF